MVVVAVFMIAVVAGWGGRCCLDVVELVGLVVVLLCCFRCGSFASALCGSERRAHFAPVASEAG